MGSTALPAKLGIPVTRYEFPNSAVRARLGRGRVARRRASRPRKGEGIRRATP